MILSCFGWCIQNANSATSCCATERSTRLTARPICRARSSPARTVLSSSRRAYSRRYTRPGTQARYIVEDVCSGSRIRFFPMPDPVSRVEKIPDPVSVSNNASIFNAKSPRKHHPGCSSRIRIFIFTYPGSRDLKAPDLFSWKEQDRGFSRVV
jgi:hypothetical protein